MPEGNGGAKAYGLLAVVRKRSEEALKAEANMVPVWPHLLVREVIAAIAVIILLHLFSTFFNAPLEEPANAMKSPLPVAKAPWYFLGLQEMVSWSTPFIGGVLIPGIIMTALLVLPYLDHNSSRLYRDRKVALTVFTFFVLFMGTLIIIGSFFRGANWGFFWPWEDLSGGLH